MCTPDKTLIQGYLRDHHRMILYPKRVDDTSLTLAKKTRYYVLPDITLRNTRY